MVSDASRRTPRLDGLAIKATFPRPFSSGAIGDTDVYGAQRHSPLLDILIPLEDEG